MDREGFGFSVLPGEEIELSVAAPGLKPASNRVQLKEGETREITMAPQTARVIRTSATARA